MSSLLYYFYYFITLVFALGTLWSIFRKSKPNDPIYSRIPYEQLLSAFVFIPILLRILGIK